MAREQDNSTSFKLLKYGVGIVGALAALRTIGKLKTSELMQKLQFKGFLPTLNQLNGFMVQQSFQEFSHLVTKTSLENFN